jgi:hypothetical protein
MRAMETTPAALLDTNEEQSSLDALAEHVFQV